MHFSQKFWHSCIDGEGNIQHNVKQKYCIVMFTQPTLLIIGNPRHVHMSVTVLGQSVGLTIHVSPTAHNKAIIIATLTVPSSILICQIKNTAFNK